MRSKSNPYLRITGDIHGPVGLYCKLASKAEYSIQLGDLGFDYTKLKSLDATKHKVLGGNHDNYASVDGVFINQTDHFLGDYGVYNIPKISPIFFLRGGNSIDKNMRVQGRDWWAEEELTYKQMSEALELYKSTKPDFVISHECPESIIKYVGRFDLWEGKPILPSQTAKVLQAMLEEHQPSLWLFGHHHVSWGTSIGKTIFKCLNIFEYMDMNPSE